LHTVAQRRSPSMRSPDSRPSAPTVLLAVGLVFAAAYSIGLVALRKPDGRIVAGDAVHYYVYVRSLIFDWDFQFENDYLRWDEAAGRHARTW
jgi:hypothetical protein